MNTDKILRSWQKQFEEDHKRQLRREHDRWIFIPGIFATIVALCVLGLAIYFGVTG